MNDWDVFMSVVGCLLFVWLLVKIMKHLGMVPRHQFETRTLLGGKFYESNDAFEASNNKFEIIFWSVSENAVDNKEKARALKEIVKIINESQGY